MGRSISSVKVLKILSTKKKFSMPQRAFQRQIATSQSSQIAEYIARYIAWRSTVLDRGGTAWLFERDIFRPALSFATRIPFSPAIERESRWVHVRCMEIIIAIYFRRTNGSPIWKDLFARPMIQAYSYKKFYEYEHVCMMWCVPCKFYIAFCRFSF